MVSASDLSVLIVLNAVQGLADELHLGHGPVPEEDPVQFSQVEVQAHQLLHDAEAFRVRAAEGEVPGIRADAGIQADRDVPVQLHAQRGDLFPDQQAGGGRLPVHAVHFHEERVGRVVVDLRGARAFCLQRNALTQALFVAHVHGEQEIKGAFVPGGLAHLADARQEIQLVRYFSVAEKADLLAQLQQGQAHGRGAAEGVPVRADMADDRYGFSLPDQTGNGFRISAPRSHGTPPSRRRPPVPWRYARRIRYSCR